jgi:hypothetical protein
VLFGCFPRCQQWHFAARAKPHAVPHAARDEACPTI